LNFILFCSARRSNRIAATRPNVRPSVVTLNDSDDDLQITSTSTTHKHKKTRNKQSRGNVTAHESQTISDSDDEFNAHLTRLQQETTKKPLQSSTTRSLRSVGNTTNNQQTNQEKGKGKKRKNGLGKGKENVQTGGRPGDSKQKRIRLQQTTMDDYADDSAKARQGKHSKKCGKTANRRGTTNGCYGDIYSAGPSTSTDFCDYDVDDDEVSHDGNAYSNDNEELKRQDYDENKYNDDDDDDDQQTYKNNHLDNLKYNDDDNDTGSYKKKGKNVNCNMADGRNKAKSCSNHSYEHTTDSETENDTIVLPTPQDKNKRSLFTKRQHKPISCGFDDAGEHARIQNGPCQVMDKKKSCKKKLSPPKKKFRRRIKVYDTDSD